MYNIMGGSKLFNRGESEEYIVFCHVSKDYKVWP